MKHVSDSLPQTGGEKHQPNQQNQQARWLDEAAERSFAAAWVEMSRMWPSYWAKHMGDVGGETYKTWGRTLAGLASHQIERGLERLRYSGAQFPPSAPEFRRYCAPRPEDVGLPDADTAMHKAQKREWDPYAVWHARQLLVEKGWSGYDMRRATPDEIMPDWRRVWGEILQRADAGEHFERPPEDKSMFPRKEEGRTLTDEEKEEAERNYQELKKQLGVRNNKTLFK